MRRYGGGALLTATGSRSGPRLLGRFCVSCCNAKTCEASGDITGLCGVCTAAEANTPDAGCGAVAAQSQRCTRVPVDAIGSGAEVCVSAVSQHPHIEGSGVSCAGFSGPIAQAVSGDSAHKQAGDTGLPATANATPSAARAATSLNGIFVVITAICLPQKGEQPAQGGVFHPSRRSIRPVSSPDPELWTTDDMDPHGPTRTSTDGDTPGKPSRQGTMSCSAHP